MEDGCQREINKVQVGGRCLWMVMEITEKRDIVV